MKRLMAITMPIAALALGACGGTAGTGGQGGGRAADPAGTVSARQLPRVGTVLVDASGRALYTPDQEARGKIVCTGACNAFWKPLTAGAGKPTAPAGAGTLGVISRPDGTRQITAGGKPLYTFAEDSPGKATGDGFTDDFAGHHFTWHIVHAGGTKSSGNGATGGGTVPSHPNSSYYGA